MAEMEEFEKEEGGITLGYIFRTIFSQKWLALIVAAVITIVGSLSIYFIGKGKKEYSVAFVSKIVGSENSPLSFIFPDGKEYRYEIMVSYNNLEKAKASNELFKDIDIATMYEKGDISANRVLSEIVKGSNQYEATYQITAKAKYFKTKVIARDFLSELAQYPNHYLEEMVIDLDRWLEVSNSAIQYDKQLDYLNSQASFLSSGYSSFIGTYGDIVVKDGKPLSFYQAQLLTFLDRGDIWRLKNSALKNSYVKGDENGQPLEAALANYRSEQFEKEREIIRLEEALENAIKSVLSSSSNTSDSSSTDSSSVIFDAESIMGYTTRIAQLNQDLEDIQKFIDNSTVDVNFDKEVEGIKAQIETFTNVYAEIASIVYTTKTTVNFLNTSIIKVEGGFGIVISAGIGLVLGLIIAAVVAYIVGWNKQRKTAVADSAKAFPVYGDAQLQTAVTADEEDSEDKKDKK